jgi:hypothetical protein
MPEQTQSFEKHAKFVPMFHFVLLPVLLVTFIGAVTNFQQSLGDHERLYSASLILVLSFALIITSFFARVFALGAQDRAIRAEENFRHYLITGKPLDSRLSLKQVVGLRFASDAEFPALAKKAAETGMSQKEIKQSIKNWKPDHERV